MIHLLIKKMLFMVPHMLIHCLFSTIVEKYTATTYLGYVATRKQPKCLVFFFFFFFFFTFVLPGNLILVE